MLIVPMVVDSVANDATLVVDMDYICEGLHRGATSAPAPRSAQDHPGSRVLRAPPTTSLGHLGPSLDECRRTPLRVFSPDTHPFASREGQSSSVSVWLLDQHGWSNEARFGVEADSGQNGGSRVPVTHLERPSLVPSFLLASDPPCCQEESTSNNDEFGPSWPVPGCDVPDSEVDEGVGQHKAETEADPDLRLLAESWHEGAMEYIVLQLILGVEAVSTQNGVSREERPPLVLRKLLRLMSLMSRSLRRRVLPKMPLWMRQTALLAATGPADRSPQHSAGIAGVSSRPHTTVSWTGHFDLETSPLAGQAFGPAYQTPLCEASVAKFVGSWTAPPVEGRGAWSSDLWRHVPAPSRITPTAGYGIVPRWV